MFSLNEFTKVKVLDVQLLSQKNRPQGANPGVRLNLQADLPNYVLAEFDGHLRTALFTKSEAAETAKDKRQTLPGVEPISDLPNLTSIGRHVKRIAWTDQLTGYTMTIDHGTGGKSNLVLADSKLENFKFQAKEGGTVAAWWSVEVVDVPKPMLGELGMLKSREVPMTFKEPEISQRDLDDAETRNSDNPGEDKAWPFPNSPGETILGAGATKAAAPAATSRRQPLKAVAKDATDVVLEQHAKG